MEGPTQDDLDRSRRSKMEEANRLRTDDCVDKSSGSVVEIEEFPERFGTYLRTELNWSRLVADVDGSRVTGWVFWSQQDDRRKPLPVSGSVSENVEVIPNSSPKVKDKIRLALGRIILHPRYGLSLVQFWAATKIEGRTLLSTQNQPFALGKAGRSAWGLCEYRMKSMVYKFYGDIGESGEGGLGLPGRVFLRKLPESAPDVQYYSLKEYPQLNDASSCQVRSSWALPVFEHSSEICVGVLELVSAIDAITDWYDKSFLSHLNVVFQELGLQSIDPYKHSEMKNKGENKAVTSAFRELALVLETVYKLHNLPLALTWVPCSACDTLSLSQLSSEVGEYVGGFEANNHHLVDFLTVSTGHHLRKGQVAERVLSSRNMLYCSDVTQFSIAEYPLVPFARQCKLSGWFTICLHCSYTGEDVYILEFFFPGSRKDNENALTTVRAILGTMANSETFKLASGEELGEELSVEVFDFQYGQRCEYVQKIQASLDVLKNGGLTLQLGPLGQSSFDFFSEEEEDTVATISEGGTTKTREREPKKTGVSSDISLEDVLRFSSLSRSDAARGLEVSVSTLKRVCRRYGINRWPPLKEGVSPAALPNVGDTLQLDLPEEPSLMELDATMMMELDASMMMELDASMIGAHDVRTDKTLPSISHLEEKSQITFEDLQQYFGCRREDAANSLGVSVSTMKRICRRHGIPRWPSQQNRGAKMLLDSADQPSMDAVHKGRSFISAEQSNLDKPRLGERTIKIQERERGKTGVRIQISLEDILQCSDMRLHNAARELKVSSSTLKRISREYGIHRWPPRNINKVGTPQPSSVQHQEGVSQLTSDMPSNQVSDSVAHIKPHDRTFQETKMVMIRAKYVNVTIKFQLSTSSRLVELQQQVAKRLNLKDGTYDVEYKDEDNELILVACDDDWQDFIKTSTSLGENSVVVLLEPKEANYPR